MILYFSATGNCKYVAERIAEVVGDKAVSIEKRKRTVELSGDEMLGIVTPTYAWELPIIVRKFLENMTVKGNNISYVFVIATYGTTPGAAGADAEHILNKHGIKVNAKFSIQMPDTWTPIFDLSNKEKVQVKNDWAEKQLHEVIGHIQERKAGNFMKRAVPYAVRYISDVYYNNMRKTDHFLVEDSCIGCGSCAKKCPAKAIEIKEKKPVWVKERCVMCLRCLHSCPKFAIQYDNKTRNHGQYHNPHVKI